MRQLSEKAVEVENTAAGQMYKGQALGPEAPRSPALAKLSVPEHSSKLLETTWTWSVGSSAGTWIKNQKSSWDVMLCTMTLGSCLSGKVLGTPNNSD